MKLFLLIVFLAVSSNAASLGNGVQAEAVAGAAAGAEAKAGAEAGAEVGTEAGADAGAEAGAKAGAEAGAKASADADGATADAMDLEGIQTGELEELTSLDASPTPVADIPNVAKVPKRTGLDILPFPLSVFLRLIGKETIKNFDVPTICETIQVIDWDAYKDLILKEDYEGLKQKLTKDEVLTSVEELFKDYIIRYSKAISAGDTSVLENTFKDILKVFSLDKSPTTGKSISIEKIFKDWLSLIVSDKTIPKEGLDAMQKYVKVLQDALQLNKGLNSLDLSQKESIEKAANGKGAF